MITFEPIGVVRSPYTDTADIPKGAGAKHEAEGVLDIRPELEAGLADIEGFSHLVVIWVFHQSKGPELIAYPPSDDRPHGVFATRSPQRPNPIGLTVVRLLGRDGPQIARPRHRHARRHADPGYQAISLECPRRELRRGWLDAQKPGAPRAMEEGKWKMEK